MFECIKIGDMVGCFNNFYDEVYCIAAITDYDEYGGFNKTCWLWDGTNNYRPIPLNDMVRNRFVEINMNLEEISKDENFEDLEIEVTSNKKIKYIKSSDVVEFRINNRVHQTFRNVHTIKRCEKDHLYKGDLCDICCKDAIKYYSYKGYKIDFKKDEQIPTTNEKMYIGFELEFEIDVRQEKFLLEKIAMNVKKNYSDLIAECKRDGSLVYGFECVSHPIHADLITSKWFRNRMKQLLDYLKSEKGVMANTCGLHFHISNDGLGNVDNTRANLLLMGDVFQDELKKISGRYELMSRNDLINYCPCDWEDEEDDDCDYEEEPRDLFSYCCFINKKPISRRRQRKSYYLSSLKSFASHYNAINIENANTTELRFFGGTLDIDRFCFNADFVKQMCIIATNDDVNNITFGDIIENISDDNKKNKDEYLKDIDITKTLLDYDLIETDPFDKQKLNVILDNLKQIDDYSVELFKEHIYYRRDSICMGCGFERIIPNLYCTTDLYLKDKINVDTYINRIESDVRTLDCYIQLFEGGEYFMYSRVTSIMRKTLREIDSDKLNALIELIKDTKQKYEEVIQSV